MYEKIQRPGSGCTNIGVTSRQTPNGLIRSMRILWGRSTRLSDETKEGRRTNPLNNRKPVVSKVESRMRKSSARVSRAGFCLAPKRSFCLVGQKLLSRLLFGRSVLLIKDCSRRGLIQFKLGAHFSNLRRLLFHRCEETRDSGF